MSDALAGRIRKHLSQIYADLTEQECFALSQRIFKRCQDFTGTHSPTHVWNEKTAVVISYADSIYSKGTSLRMLDKFFKDHLSDVFNSLHILPFFQATSDDGFSVQNYREITSDYGDWSDIKALASSYHIMADLVLNHCSQSSDAFKGFLDGEPRYSKYFFEPDADFDLSKVTRPRPQSVIQEFKSHLGLRRVWATFSRDQVDLNYRDPQVLYDMIDHLLYYLEQGIDVIRLDAVAFLWKTSGTACVNLPETHEVVRLMRSIVDVVKPSAILVTETNLPNQQNVNYFGNGSEAHWVYNFPLPPLIIYALLQADSDPLKHFTESLPPALKGMAYLNFLASHDGIGLRPTEGLLTDNQFKQFTDRLIKNGSLISYRAQPDGSQTPYEANISLFSALQYTDQDPHGTLSIERFIAAHAIMVAIGGIPAIYLNSLLGALNHIEGVEQSGIPRRINRQKFSYEAIENTLLNTDSRPARIFNSLKHLMKIRAKCPEFHPNASQFTLQLPSCFFGVWRQSLDDTCNLVALTNITANAQQLPSQNLKFAASDAWHDQLEGRPLDHHELNLDFEPYQTRWITLA